MGVETGDTIATLNEAWPAGSEPHSQGDDHLRQLKHVIKADALSKADGGVMTGDVDLTVTSTVGGSPIASAGDLAGFSPTTHTHAQVDITNLPTDLTVIRNDIDALETGVAGVIANKANIASPALTGTPTAPTAVMICKPRWSGRLARPSSRPCRNGWPVRRSSRLPATA
jgi:hypothetical protein